jgi:hypothetical protein
VTNPLVQYCANDTSIQIKEKPGRERWNGIRDIEWMELFFAIFYSNILYRNNTTINHLSSSSTQI